MELKNIQNIIHDNMMTYSQYVITNRALPDIRDGLKPSYRRILVTMDRMKISTFTKSQNVSGQTMKIHAHGDCLSGDTKLRLLSGEVKTFAELEKEGKSHWVLSVDCNGNIVPALAHSFRKVKRVDKLKVIKFANGFEVKSTDDHKFRLINGEWLEAKDIKQGHTIDYGLITGRDKLNIQGHKTQLIGIDSLVDNYLNCNSNNTIHESDDNDFAKLLPTVIETYYIDADEIVYDFSVEGTHNALISVSDDDRTLAVAHNCYPTIVGMVQTDNNITPWIKGKGSFGQHTSKELQAAAPRYTEVCLSDISKDVFKDIDKKMVNFIPNYDGTIMIPEVLPVQFPSILHYAQSGIAVGMSCSLPSHNLKEINDATKHYILTGEHTVLIPDFATGGEIIENHDAFRQICETGTGTIRLRAKAEIIGNTISIKEIPYTTTREAIIEQIVKLVKGKKIDTISNVQDLTGLEGMEIEITAKRNTNMTKLLAQLYKYTPMETTFSANMNILVDKLPKVIGTNRIIEIWVEWRRQCIKNGIEYELENINEKLHRLLGLENILLDIDKAIEIIRTSEEDKINESLMQSFNIDTIQAEYVSNIKLRHLNKDAIIRQTQEIDALKENIKNMQDALNDNSKIDEMIITGLDEISKKYSEQRRTKIVAPTIEDVSLDVEPSVTTRCEIDTSTKYKVILTKQGYFKKLPVDCENIQIKDGDVIANEFIVTNASEIGVFVGTDMYKLYISQYDVHKQSDIGIYLPTLLDVNKIEGYTLIDDTSKYTLIVYDNMKVAKIDNKSYKTASKRTKLENSLCLGANVVQIVTLFDDVQFKVLLKNKEKICNTADMKAKMTRSSQGVVIKNDKIVIL